MKKRCVVHTCDYFINYIRTEDEVFELFGEDYFGEWNDDVLELDQSIIDECIAVKKRMFELSDLLQKELDAKRKLG